jgi:polyisoprenyl-phosphate glycosyltransferase
MKNSKIENQAPEISVVIPVHNEQENIPELFERLTVVLEVLCDREGFTKNCFEVIMVDDGSRDDSWKLIQQIHTKDGRLKGLKFSRNFGHHYAITAGLDFAKGNGVVLMDGDLQDKPEEIVKLYDKFKEGYDLVYGIRNNRQDSPAKKALAAMFWWSINQVAEVKMPENQTMLRILRREMVDSLKGMKEYSRFVHGMMAWTGFDVTQIEVSHGARLKGTSKYDLKNQIRLALHAVTSFSIMPLRIAAILGLLTSILSFTVGAYYILKKVIFGFPVSGWASIMVSVFFMGGVQLLMLGTFGEYLGKIYKQSQQRPMYILKEVLN